MRMAFDWRQLPHGWISNFHVLVPLSWRGEQHLPMVLR
jgi:hypothetical protein